MTQTTQPLKSSAVCAVVVTYHPDDDFGRRLQELLAQVAHVVIVDNASSAAQRARLRDLAQLAAVSLIENPRNLGIATALNKGIAEAQRLQYLWVVTLDQDSRPAEDMVERLLLSLYRAPQAETIALVGPRIVLERLPEFAYPYPAPHPYLPLWYRVRHCAETDLEDVTMIITSGTLLKLSLFEQLGGFREDYFIDYVDTEYCLRAKRAGFRIVVSCDAVLYHSLGQAQEKYVAGINLKSSFHSSLRLYYIHRNRIVTIRAYALHLPHWFFFDLVNNFYGLLGMLLVEDKRLVKLLAVWWGIRDGILGNMGSADWGINES